MVILNQRRNRRRPGWSLLFGLFALTVTATVDGQDKPADSFSEKQARTFEREVLPILKSRCFKCHGAEPKLRGNLRLTSRAGILKGGDLGPAIDLDAIDESPLLDAIHYDGLEMPPTGKLPAEEIATLEKWIKQRLPWSNTTIDYGIKSEPTGSEIGDGRDYWAYQPIVSPQVPLAKPDEIVRNPIDSFLIRKLREAGLKPVGEADRIALMRRAHYDLTGLPPSPEEVRKFATDPDPDAYEKLLDRLLESPRYGEKWGRFWLDLVRFAETHGYERDSTKPFAWRYRDYVIESFNSDKPYDQFLIEQLAGDELDEVTSETLTATGFYRLGIWDDEPADRLQAHYDMLDDVVSTTSQVMLGMTLGCARCHDHKKDPLPQSDYYQFLAFFHDITPMNRENLRRHVTDTDRTKHEQQKQERQQQEGAIYARVFGIEQDLLKRLRDNTAAGDRVIPASDLAEVRFRFYRDTFETLPDFSGLKPETEGVLESNRLSLSPASRQKAIGLVFDARLKVPRADTYKFTIQSADGVRLSVNGNVVLQRPERGGGSISGRIELPAGLVPLQLEYFNAYSKPNLKVSWRSSTMQDRLLTEPEKDGGPVLTPDARKRSVPWRYTTAQPTDGWTSADFDDGKWSEGPSGFGSANVPKSVIKTAWSNSDIWLRRRFKVQQLPESLALLIHHDEDAEVYLNGQQIFSGKGYLKDYRRVALTDEAREALKTGENVLAIHCRQTGGGQYIDAGLVEDAETLDIPALLARHGKQLLGDQTLGEHARLTKELENLRKRPIPEPGTPIMSVGESGRRQTHVLIRGSAHAPGEKVGPLVPAVLQTSQPRVPDLPDSAPSSRKRLTLARWITSPDNPLTARVFMNRLWQVHFGLGIVPTPNDFGKLGEQPSHPELLTWLAHEFIKSGWKIKRMHKLLMMSAAYRRSSRASEEGLASDPSNRLLWRFNMRRLTAEEFRDSILSVSGQLNLKAGGPGVYAPIPEEVLRGQSRPGAGWGKSSPEEAARRSVYVHVKRSLLVPILEMHDLADTDSSCPVRYTTTVPTQSLGLLNGDFTNHAAEALARRLEKEFPDDIEGQIRRAVLLTSGRAPSAAEIAADRQFLEKIRQQHKLDAAGALNTFCLLILNTNAFAYLD